MENNAMDGINSVSDIGFWDKFNNLSPFMLWGLVIILFLVVAVWLFDKFALPNQDLRKELDGGNIAWALVLSTLIFGFFFFASSAIGAPTKYDRHFRKAAKIYFSTTIPWQYAKAQGMQESRLDPAVCSHAGACGLMQFMPGTAKQFRIDPYDARASIYASAKYMRWLYGNWTSPRPKQDRYDLALGSYNWGIGSMLQAQKRAAASGVKGNLFAHLEPYLPRETKEYPYRIQRWCNRFRKASCAL